MKRLLSSLLSVAALLAAASVCRADEELKPVVAVFVSSCDNLVNKLAADRSLGQQPGD